jgi:hypothetical protein
MKVSALKLYANVQKELFAELQHKIHYDAAMNSDLVYEYTYYGAAYFRNFFPNMLALHKSYSGSQLFGKFTQIPAIICGAGPSLKKHLSLIRNIKNQALIFAGGSALNALNHGGVWPHFGVGVDPNDEQYLRFIANTCFEIPYFYRNRLNHQAFNTIRGPRLYLNGAGGYNLSEWFEEELDIPGEILDEGHNVVNLSLEIAHALGCNPIIFVGMDLSYTGMKAYAPGVISSPEKQVISQGTLGDEVFQKKNIYGKKVYTQWKWVAESEWVSTFAKNHPEKTLINATEGGLGFLGIPNIPLKEVISKYLVVSYDLQSLVHGEIQNSAMSHITGEKVVHLVHELRESLERCLANLEILMEEENKKRIEMLKNKGKDGFKQSTEAILAETELLDEIGYRYLLDVFNTIYQHILFQETHQVTSRKNVF